MTLMLIITIRLGSLSVFGTIKYMSTISVVRGRELSSEELEVINEYRTKEFHSVNAVAPRPDNDDWDKPYFLVADQGRLMAFGRLHQTIAVSFKGVRYQILGISGIVAIARGHGYGRELMHEIKRYIGRSGLTAIGFCSPDTSSFYAKCGYEILINGVKRFRFIGEDGQELPPDYDDDDVLYLDDGGLMRAVIQHTEEPVIAYRVAW